MKDYSSISHIEESSQRERFLKGDKSSIIQDSCGPRRIRRTVSKLALLPLHMLKVSRIPS